MILSEMIEIFRLECPDIPDRKVSDALLKKWAKLGDKEVCALTRCIVSDFTLTSVVSTSVYDTKYDLTTEEPKFYDIDDFPGGGVSYDDEPLVKTTVSELDAGDSSWRTRSAGTPKKYYRRGKFLYFDYPVKTASEVRVYAALVSDDFNTDDITPYNQLGYLEPFHQAIVKYLIWKAKAKEGEPQARQLAAKEFYDYIAWMKKMITAGKVSKIQFIPESGVYQGTSRR